MKKIRKKDKINIIILSIVKIDNFTYKLIYYKDIFLKNENYKGFFIEEKIIHNDILFRKIKYQKRYKAIEDYEGNLQYLFNRKECISL